jgi:hypothetical protein
MKRNIILTLVSVFLLSACDDLFEPANDNFKDLSQINTEPTFGRSFLIQGYSRMPGYYNDSDYATDDAVTNQKGNTWLNTATGSWTAQSNPANQWDASNAAILYLNRFLANGQEINYVTDPVVTELIRMRARGEAYGLRALHLFNLLKAHAGYSADGELLGVPLFDEFLEANADFNMPRAGFMDCVQHALEDLSEAEKLLPDEYNDITSSEQIPAKYRSVTTTWELYNRAMGKDARQLFNGLIVKSIRSRLTLLAASPAFQDATNTVTWADAADAAAAALDVIGGINAMAANGVTYYANTSEINNLGEGINPPEMIWRENVSNNNTTQEGNNYPPTLFGKGYLNPTQNLVDAFPMANGYPIDASGSGYNAATPYANRDPRLANYIIYRGAQAGPSSAVIYTGSADGTNDGVNILETSTRTGYYMKKRLIMSVNCDPSYTSGQTHYNPRIRATEIFLNYAEAANEAWGPKSGGSHSYSAYDVIRAIRQRAGVGGATDPYLEECAADKDRMRALIRNERRLELCFEGFRFWDLRRW